MSEKKTIVEEIDSILDADAQKSYFKYDSMDGAIQRVGDKLDILNKLIALALKQKYGCQK